MVENTIREVLECLGVTFSTIHTDKKQCNFYTGWFFVPYHLHMVPDLDSEFLKWSPKSLKKLRYYEKKDCTTDHLKEVIKTI